MDSYYTSLVVMFVRRSSFQTKSKIPFSTVKVVYEYLSIWKFEIHMQNQVSWNTDSYPVGQKIENSELNDYLQFLPEASNFFETFHKDTDHESSISNFSFKLPTWGYRYDLVGMDFAFAVPIGCFFLFVKLTGLPSR